MNTVIGPHFLKRYKERTYQEDKDLEQALMDSTWACREGKTIYETEIVNNKQGRVVAVLDGLILGDCDLDKGFYYARTYVSDDMLQPIQREAKKLLNDHLFDRCINYVLDSTNKLEIEEHDDLVDSLNAKSIYAKYYASTEEHLDFLVTNAPEDIKLDFKYNNSSAQKSKRKTEIPAVVQKMAGDKRVRLASVLEDQIPIVYIYLATSLKIGNRYEEAILYCPYTDKAARVRNSEMSTHKLQTTVIEITKR